MNWQETLQGDTLSWLLEPEDPGVRYLALRDLVGLPKDDPDLLAAQTLAHQAGPIASILEKMEPEGFWARAGHGYNPKYRSTVWSIIVLGQLGASIQQDERIARTCAYLLDHGLTQNGGFTTNGVPSGTVDCLQGNLCNALLDLGCQDPRLEPALEWMARSQTGEGIAPLEDKHAPIRYFAYKCGPDFLCGVNGSKPCAWGAVKVLLAFSKLPHQQRTPLIEEALQKGINFLFSVDPASAAYPTRLDSKPNRSWWKFGFPIFYVTDILQNVEALVRLGYGKDPRLANALNLIREKQDVNGRWALEYNYIDKTWVNFGEKKMPNKWVSLRAAWVLKHAS